jgi:oligopeptidase B
VPEEVLLDENAEAARHEYYTVGDVSVSDDGKRLGYSEDTVGSELYTVRIIDLATRRQLLSKPIGNTSGAIEWAADNKTFFFVTNDDKQRPYKACSVLQKLSTSRLVLMCRLVKGRPVLGVG